jgi:hypothetical protein
VNHRKWKKIVHQPFAVLLSRKTHFQHQAVNLDFLPPLREDFYCPRRRSNNASAPSPLLLSTPCPSPLLLSTPPQRCLYPRLVHTSLYRRVLLQRFIFKTPSLTLVRRVTRLGYHEKRNCAEVENVISEGSPDSEKSRFEKHTLSASVLDPDPNPNLDLDPLVRGMDPAPGSGSFYHHAKIVRKTLIPTILRLFLTFLSLKNYVNVPSKSNKQKKLC